MSGVPRDYLQPRTWRKLDKHRKATVRNWPNAINWTANGGDSQYHPKWTDDDVRSFEFDCIDKGQVYVDHDKIKKFYMKRNDIVGACSGEPTYYVFAEWHASDGSVHGRPISVKRLREMGVSV